MYARTSKTADCLSRGASRRPTEPGMHGETEETGGSKCEAEAGMCVAAEETGGRGDGRRRTRAALKRKPMHALKRKRSMHASRPCMHVSRGSACVATGDRRQAALSKRRGHSALLSLEDRSASSP